MRGRLRVRRETRRASSGAIMVSLASRLLPLESKCAKAAESTDRGGESRVRERFECRTDPFARGALHKALQRYRTMLAREMNVALADAFVSGERRILSGEPAGITAPRERIACEMAQRRLSRVLSHRAWKRSLEIGDERVRGCCRRGRCARGIRRSGGRMTASHGPKSHCSVSRARAATENTFSARFATLQKVRHFQIVWHTRPRTMP